MDRKLYSTLLVYTFTLLMCYLFFTVLAPFFSTIVWAGAIGMATYPFYNRLKKLCRNRTLIPACIMVLLVAFALIAPLAGLIFTLARETAVAYQYLENISSVSLETTITNILRHPVIAPWLDEIQTITESLDLDVVGVLLPTAKKWGASLLNFSSGLVKDFLGFLVKSVFMLIILFFIYLDGAHFMQRFWAVTGVTEKLKISVTETVERVLTAVVYGILLTCVVQGILGGLGFWVAGLPSPLLFGTLMAVCAPIPFIGTALIWLPGAIYLLISGKTFAGIMLIVWGLAVVSSIDNVIRPLFISGKSRLPILVVVLGVLGGLLAFGLTGVVAGPIILALFLVFFNEYHAHSTDSAKPIPLVDASDANHDFS